MRVLRSAQPLGVDPLARTVQGSRAVDVERVAVVAEEGVVPGRFDERLEWNYRTANVIDNLRYCCEVLEAAGLIMVIEPLNSLKDHPGLFLTKIPQAYMICEAVNSPSCKIINDL